MLLPWAFLGFIGGSSQQELDPVFEPVFGEHKHDLLKLLARNPGAFRGLPEDLPQVIPSLHVMVQIGPHHQSRVAAHLQASPEFNGHRRNETGSAPAIHGADYVVAWPRTNPLGIKRLEKGPDENRVNAPALLALVETNHLSAASHGPTLALWLRPR